MKQFFSIALLHFVTKIFFSALFTIIFVISIMPLLSAHRYNDPNYARVLLYRGHTHTYTHRQLLLAVESTIEYPH